MKEERKEEETKQNNTYDLSDEQCDLLNQHANMLRSYQVTIGAQFCEILNNVQQANQIEENIKTIQNDISEELNIPRAKRINWNLTDKKIEIVNK
ncbi:MAG: hypothetical protein ACOCV1_05780 [Bacillota bacterium]